MSKKTNHILSRSMSEYIEALKELIDLEKKYNELLDIRLEQLKKQNKVYKNLKKKN